MRSAGTLRRTLVIGTLALLLAAALGAIAILYPMANRTFAEERDRAFVVRAQQEAARQWSLPLRQMARATYPIAIRADHLICVELRWRRSDAQVYIACFDERKGGEPVEERIIGPSN